MSTPGAKRSEPEQSLIQDLLNERRELLIANERLRLDLEEVRARSHTRDPRVARMERENRALREELAAERARLEQLTDALARIVARLERAQAG